MQGKPFWLKKRSKRKKLVKTHAPITHLIPSLVTLTGMFFGLLAIHCALEHKWQESCLAIMAAFCMDAMDGGLARLLSATSRMGAELDSLADVVSFGVAPTVLVFNYNQSNSKVLWALAIFYTMSIALRLARFNVTDHQSYPAGFFQGVPAPSAALLAITPIVLDTAFYINFFVLPYGYSAWLLMTSLLAVSKIPTLSIKQRVFNRKERAACLLVFSLSIAALFAYPWLCFIFITLGYLALIPCSVYMYKRLDD